MSRLEDNVVISGIGMSEVGRTVTRTGLGLTVDAIVAAVADAGLELSDIDGLITWPGDVGYTGGLTASSEGFCGPSVPLVKDTLRLQLNWHAAGPEGPAMLGSVLHGCLAVASGLCRHALVYRTLTEASAQHGGHRRGIGHEGEGVTGYLQWSLPYGGFSGGNWMAPYAQRYFHTYGTTREQLAWVALNGRRHAARNPKAVFRHPLTMDDYVNARMISTPLCLFDCDIPVDGSTAIVISAADHAPNAPNGAIKVAAIGSALNGRASWDNWEDMTCTAASDVGEHLWSRTDLRPSDVDVAGIYDGFSILSLMWLEGLQLCGRGEAAAFVEGGTRTDLDGELPMNTSGGQLSGGRLHSFGHLYEVVTQLRGHAGDRQVAGAEVGITSSGAGPLASAMLLTR